jgi:hypothetical protein
MRKVGSISSPWYSSPWIVVACCTIPERGQKEWQDEDALKSSRVPGIPPKWEFGRFFKAKVNKLFFFF